MSVKQVVSIALRHKLCCSILISWIATNLILISKFTTTSSVSYLVYYIRFDSNDISCHNVQGNDALPVSEDEKLSAGKSIFFHETSCKGGLNSRQACAVESAARNNPSWSVNVLFSGAVSSTSAHGGTLVTLRSYGNVRLLRIHGKEYAAGTPAEQILDSSSKFFIRSSFPITHSSELLRFLTMYKYGGVYLDLDVISLRPFDTLPENWVAREYNPELGSAALGFSRNRLGRIISEGILREFRFSYDPTSWTGNGAGLIEKYLDSVCTSILKPEMSATTCKENVANFSELHVFNRKYFHAIPWQEYKQYFKQGDINVIFNDSYTAHIWNAMSKDSQVTKDSVFENLAKRHCPAIYGLYGDDFGL